ncbi:hypothetical protein LOK49_LG10G02031 [Camellia lanceoleosa]|uniref:Uncharacterized protein n=1 Tax=Camellia lanceoleosa TaxID=1840588 RepID=A0ACC0GAH8_9ERIC|nr:hypothetical protein LOK49_LG10G02031 [Camellia lanceoleosa]
MWEEEEEQIRECGGSDSVWERLRNQPIYSPPPPSPSSGKVFLISPQFFFSQPPPLTPQLHFSPPPTTSVLMSPYLDFSATTSVLMSASPVFSSIQVLPPLQSLIVTNVPELRGQIKGERKGKIDGSYQSIYHEKHDSRLRCIRTPLHAGSSPRTTAILDGGEMVQLDSSKQQSLVEFNVTNNSAYLIRASQSCSTVSHSDETNSRETLKRKCPTESALSFEDLQQHFGCKRDDAAKALGVSKTDCILLEPQGEKDVSPTYSKMPTDGQTERGNEMVGHLQDQNAGPNLSNTENGSNEESITTLIFQDSVPVSEMDCILLEPEREKNVSPTFKTRTVGIVLDFKEGPNLSNIDNHSNEESITTPTFKDSVPVFKRDCILLEPQGEKNASPTHKTPTNGQTEVGNGMVGHIQDQNGIVPEFIGPNLSNTENCSNEKSLTIPNFQGSVPSNYPAMDFSISSTYRESGEARGSSELAFQPNELTPSTAYPNPNACVFTQPHISLREMPTKNVGSLRDSRNFSTSAVGLWALLKSNGLVLSRRRYDQEELQIISEDCKTEKKPGLDRNVIEEVYKTQKAIQAIMQHKNGGQGFISSFLKESPPSSYMRLSGDSGRFHTSSDIQLFRQDCGFSASSPPPSATQISVSTEVQSPVRR